MKIIYEWMKKIRSSFTFRKSPPIGWLYSQGLQVAVLVCVIWVQLGCSSKLLPDQESADSISVDSVEGVSTIYLTDYFVEQSIDVDSVNSLLRKNDFPFSVKEEGGEDGPSRSLVYVNSVTVFHSEYTSPEYVSLIRRATQDDTQYGIVISEDVVGLDYWLFIFSNDSTIYVTDKFNENAEPYEMEDDISSCRNGFITVKYQSGIVRRVKCSPLKATN
ncbi:MAG: hypothetical protein MJZ77_09035 [Bacteroidales bacterium]|nr:hypothetical protein [Bacteroidales bacterium]